MGGPDTQEQHPIPASQRGLNVSYTALAAVLGALLVAAGVAACGGGGKHGTTTTTTTTNKTAAPSIHFHYPKAWKLVKPSSVAGVPKSASAVLQRTHNTGVLVVLRSGKAKVNAAAATKMNSQLKGQYSDYRFVSAKAIKLPHAGRAMLFTYVRTKQGVLHTITVIPAGTISFVVETASPPANRAIAKEIGKILRSATLTYPSK